MPSLDGSPIFPMTPSSLGKFHRTRMTQALKVSVISLGCVRNTVDSETLLGGVLRKGHVISDEKLADAVIVNTCGFIESAKKESIDVISDLVRLKKEGRLRLIIVAGCLAQRYAEELRLGFPEVDAIIGALSLKRDSHQSGVSITPRYMAYLKICESCYNHCTFCAIPGIKGKFVSRSMPSILDDVRAFDGRGVREINVVGQDVTAYGMDIGREKLLAPLLRKIARTVRHVDWIRLLYTFPAHVTDELIDVIGSEPRICKYIDMPLQHINDRILKAMNRNITRRQTEVLINKIRRKIPGVSLRTTFIVGFPGETEAEFRELLDFMRDHPFERAGGFMYSKEEGTGAFALPGHVPMAVRRERLERLMEVQEAIAAGLQEKMIGRTLRVLVESKDKKASLYIGRSEFDAPDVDGNVFIKGAEKLEPGVFVDVKIISALGHDLEGVMV